MTAARQPPGVVEALAAEMQRAVSAGDWGRAAIQAALVAFAAEAVAAERERFLAELSRRYNERYAQAEAEGQSRAGSYLRARGREITEIEGWLRWKGLAP